MFFVMYTEKNLMRENVHGRPLQSCSKTGMALTGFTRKGVCVDHNDDAGSHHVCLDISSAPHRKNFCTSTKQPAWCTKSMPCHKDSNKQCDVKNWCVCEWAFSDYVAAVGCENVGQVDCSATNKLALKHYLDANDDKSKSAYNCLKKLCKL